MVTRRLHLLPVIVSLLIALAVAVDFSAAEGPGVAGRWRLIEQRYNTGAHDFAEGAPTTWLVVAPDGSAVVETAAWRAAWPAWAGPDGPAALASWRIVSAGPAVLDAEYRVAAAPGDETELAVRETCRPEGGGRLRCVIAVRFAPPGRDAGGFTWTRVYALDGGR